MAQLAQLLEQADEACRRRHCEEAVASLEEAVRLLPSDASLHYRLGICYSGGCGNHAGRSPETGVFYLRHALALLEASPGQQLARARILDATARAHLASHVTSPPERMRAAIECCREAAHLYLDGHELEEWAREEFNMGNICCDLASADPAGGWEDAIAHYERSLEVRTEAADSMAHAATLQNLATAYREVPSGDRHQNVRKAILCSFGALRIYRAAGMKVNCAALHNNIGNAYLSLPAASAAVALRSIRRALRHFERALERRTRDGRPLEYAATQLNRGEALLRLAYLGTHDALAFSEACFLEAAECFASCGLPDLAAAAQVRVECARALHARDRGPE